MKKMIFAVSFAALVFFALTGPVGHAVELGFAEKFAGGLTQTGDTGAYAFDKAHSFIGFKVKHLGLIEVPGYFRDFVGTVNYDAADITRSSVEFTAKATSVDTGVAPRDRHLRTADFFDVEKFPDLTFKSTKVAKKGKNLMLTGDLTIRGVTKSVTFPFQIAGFLPADERSGGKMGITAETTINRRDFGVSYGSTLPSGVAQLSDEVKVVLQIEANKAKEEAKAQ
jgi:polyisoprenoid-binding protein YceI